MTRSSLLSALKSPRTTTSGVTDSAILEAALEAFETLDTPGGVVSLPLRWADTDAWKDTVMRPTPGGDGALEDDRSERHAAPQYQCEADRLAAESASAQLRSD